MATITTINGSDLPSNSRGDINSNFANLNSDKIETSYLDTDTTLAANSDSKIPTQKAVKAYVDTGGNVNASTTQKGIVEEATQAEVDAGTATGATGARLFISPAVTITSPLKASFVFGETIAAGEAVVIASGGSAGTQTISQTTDSFDDDTDADVWRGQSFATPSNACRIDSIRIRGRKTGSPTGNLTMYIRTAIGSGTIYTSTVPYSSIGTSDADITFTFTDAFIVAGVTYYFVISPGDVGGGTKYLNIRYGGGYAGGARYVSSGGDSGWATSGGGTEDLDFTITLTDTTAGRVYRSSAQVAARTDGFIGFATEAGIIGQTKAVQIMGIPTGLTSITIGSTYYLANTPGAIATSAGTVSRKIGMGVSTTSLLIKNDNI